MESYGKFTRSPIMLRFRVDAFAHSHGVLGLHIDLVSPYDAVLIRVDRGVPVHLDGARIDGVGSHILRLSRN